MHRYVDIHDNHDNDDDDDDDDAVYSARKGDECPGDTYWHGYPEHRVGFP